MKISVNGKPREVDAPAGADALPLPDFLRAHEINPRLVAIAINGAVIAKDTYATACIHEGDAVEVVRMVGGGAR